jgi:hypothetical protein
VTSNHNNSSNVIQIERLKIDQIIACLYEEDGRWYFGKIIERNQEETEVKVQFFKPVENEYTKRGCQLSTKKDVAYVPLNNIVKLVQSLKKHQVVRVSIM